MCLGVPGWGGRDGGREGGRRGEDYTSNIPLDCFYLVHHWTVSPLDCFYLVHHYLTFHDHPECILEDIEGREENKDTE